MTSVLRSMPVAIATVTAVAGALFYLKAKQSAPVGPRRVVITGSTKGIGFALAKKHLSLGDDVVVNSRSNDAVQKAVEELSALKLPGKVYGFAADTSLEADTVALLKFAVSKLSQIDIWICNAGTGTEDRAPIWEQPASEISKVVQLNVFGSLLAAKVVLKQFVAQGSGTLWFMEGAGSNGMTTPTFASYGASKACYMQMMKTLNLELANAGHDNVFVGNLQPGLVLTDMLVRRDIDSNTAKVFNAIAEEPDTVANFLVPRLRVARGRNVAIRWLTPVGVAYRFARAPFWRADYFDEKTGAFKRNLVLKANSSNNNTK